MTVIQKILWLEVFKKGWETRNDILHHSKNFYRNQESENLGRKIRWFVEHWHEMAKYCDQFMLEMDLTRLGRNRLKTRRRWVENNEIERRAWEDKLCLGESRLRRITKFFQPRLGADQDPDLGRDPG